MGSFWTFAKHCKIWAKLCISILARLHWTMIIQTNQVHQDLFTLGDVFDVTLPDDNDKKEISPGTT